MSDTIQRLFKVKWTVFGLAITLLAMPAGAMPQGKPSQSTPPPDNGLLQTGNDYLAMCGSAFEAKGLSGVTCISYTWGLFTGLSTTQRLFAALERAPMVCVPATVSMGQLARITLKWLQENPTSLHEPLGELMIVSWFNSFPCPKTS
jgi:Rap1a immunity proteins